MGFFRLTCVMTLHDNVLIKLGGYYGRGVVDNWQVSLVEFKSMYINLTLQSAARINKRRKIGLLIIVFYNILYAF